MLNILLLGVVHEYQRQDPKFLRLPKERAGIYLGQVRFYSQWVQVQICGFAGIDDLAPQVIFDEMNLPEWEPFNRLEDLQVIPWMYMDIPEHVRKWFKLTARRTPGKEIIPEIDEPRGRHWIRVIESVSAQCNLSKAVVLCGAAHLPTFSRKLTETGHSVKSADCRDAEWYNAGYSNTSYPE